MNLPTKLTVLRLVLTVVIVVLLCFPVELVGYSFPEITIAGVGVGIQYLISGVIFIIASLTDFLDGYLARKYNLVTDTGKMLDAIADKVLVNSVLIILAAHHHFSVIVPVIIVLRDIIVNAIKMEAASNGKVVAAIGSGKLKTATLMVGTILSFFFNEPFEAMSIWADDFLLYFACVLSIISAVQYYNLNKDIIFAKKGKKK